MTPLIAAALAVLAIAVPATVAMIMAWRIARVHDQAALHARDQADAKAQQLTDLILLLTAHLTATRAELRQHRTTETTKKEAA